MKIFLNPGTFSRKSVFISCCLKYSCNYLNPYVTKISNSPRVLLNEKDLSFFIPLINIQKINKESD
jgi:hypothetical protein